MKTEGTHSLVTMEQSNMHGILIDKLNILCFLNCMKFEIFKCQWLVNHTSESLLLSHPVSITRKV